MEFPKEIPVGNSGMFLMDRMELFDFIGVGIFGFDNVGFGQPWRFDLDKMGTFSTHPKSTRIEIFIKN